MLLEDQRQAIRLLLAKNSSFDLCISSINKYKQQATLFNDENHAAYADYYAAQIYINKGSILKAQQLIQGIIPIFVKNNEITFLQASYLVMGVIKNDLDNQEESLVYFEKATQLKTTIKQNQAAAYNNLTSILVEFKQYDSAIEKLKEALDLMTLKDLNDRPVYYNLLLNLSRVYLLKKNPEKSYEILQKVSKAQLKYPQDRIEAKLNTNLGSYYLYLKDYEKAIEHYDKGIAYCLEFNFKPIYLGLIVKKAQVLLLQKKIKEAEEILLNEYKNYKMENALAYKEIINSLIEIYTIKGDLTESKKYQEELDIICNR